MRQTNVKSDRVAGLLDRLTDATGESRVEALERALEERLAHVRRRDRTARLRTWLESEVWPAEPYHQNFFANNPEQGYCNAVIAPKVAKFRKRFAHLLTPNAATPGRRT